MNWIQEILTPDTPLQGPKPSLGRYLLSRTLPLLLTGLLLFWFAGGFPPTTWIAVFRIFAQFGTLWPQRGFSALVALFILLVQALLIGVAWISWTWLLLKERVVLTTIQSSLRHGSFPSFNTTIVTVVPPATFHPGLADKQAAPSSLPVASNSTAPNTAGNFGRSDILENPFEDDEVQLDFPVASNLPVPPSPPITVGPQVSLESESGYVMGDPFDVDEQSDDTVLPEGLLADPFDLPMPPDVTDDDPFIFGNPFDGELPDAVLMDEDLKNAPIPQLIKKKQEKLQAECENP